MPLPGLPGPDAVMVPNTKTDDIIKEDADAEGPEWARDPQSRLPRHIPRARILPLRADVGANSRATQIVTANMARRDGLCYATPWTTEFRNIRVWCRWLLIKNCVYCFTLAFARNGPETSTRG